MIGKPHLRLADHCPDVSWMSKGDRRYDAEQECDERPEPDHSMFELYSIMRVMSTFDSGPYHKTATSGRTTFKASRLSPVEFVNYTFSIYHTIKIMSTSKLALLHTSRI